MKFSKLILLSIVIFATVLRLWKLGEVPPSPDWDEAALGYNAYSILQTGKDEYGIKIPLVLRSFDDYKPPLYAYLTIPSVALFGLDVWSVRLPSAFAGVLAVLGTYFLVLELFSFQTQNLKSKIQNNIEASSLKHSNFEFIRNSEFGHWSLQKLALICAALLAISPWHIQFSRIAFEANIGVTLNIWALVFFLKGLSRPYYLAISAIVFGLGFYAYHSERVFVPLIVVILAILFRHELWKRKKDVLIGFFVGIITVAPLIPVIFDPTTLTRLRGTSSLSDTTGLLRKSVQRLEDDQKNGNIVGMIFDNRRIVFVKTLLEGYTSHFSFRWLFMLGDNDRHHAPDMALLYWWEFPFVLLGIYSIWKMNSRLSKFLFSWFFIVPIAAAPTSETPHAIRTLSFLPLWQIVVGVGFLYALLELRARLASRNKLKKLFFVCFSGAYVLFIIFNITLYLHMYFVHMNIEFSRFWQYGYKQVVEYAERNKSKYKKIVVSTKLEQPHMFFLFYTRYDPKKYLAEGGTASGGFAEYRNKFDIYEFKEIEWNKELHDGSVLYIGAPKDMPSNDLGSIYYLNGEEAIRMSH